MRATEIEGLCALSAEQQVIVQRLCRMGCDVEIKDEGVLVVYEHFTDLDRRNRSASADRWITDGRKTLVEEKTSGYIPGCPWSEDYDGTYTIEGMTFALMVVGSCDNCGQRQPDAVYRAILGTKFVPSEVEGKLDRIGV